MSRHRTEGQRYRWVIALLCLACAGASFAGPAEVFDGPAAEYVAAPPVTTPHPAVMRWVWVQERMQIPRRCAAVRVPIFFAAGECRDPAELVLVRWPSRRRVPVQADDVRRNADGGVARLHLWFTTEVGAGETQRWALLKRAPEVGPAVETAPAIVTTVTGDRLEVRSSGTNIAFNRDLGTRGALAALHLSEGPTVIFPQGAGAAVTLRTATGTDDVVVPGRGGSLEWGSGPVFAKVVARSRGKTTASTVEQVYRIFSDGSVNLNQTVRPPEPGERLIVKTQEFLSGRAESESALAVHAQSAGIVDSLRDVHRGYVVDGWWEGERSQGWLVVPGSLGGSSGRVEIERSREFRLRAPGGLASNEGDARPGTVRAFWSEVTLYPARRESPGLARRTLLVAAQPLVAVVDWPGLALATAVDRIEDNVREMKPVGWVNETVVRQLNGRTASFPKRNWKAEETPAHWREAARRATAKVTGGTSRRLAEDEKGKAAGPLDPYHITYGATGLGFWLMRGDLPPAPLASMRAQLEGVRQHLGRTDELGWPFLDVFARTQNMQMGPPFLALADRGADPELRRFYRDQLSAPQLAAVMLRGLRPYEGRAQSGPVPSDQLYQGVVDFYLRATELAIDESLGFHPVAFGRYLDAIDVNADLYHPARARAADMAEGLAHANFFRMQSHLHRWLNWGPAPFIALLQSPVEDGLVPGTTEVWYFADALAGRWKNWPDQSWLFLAAALTAKTGSYAPALRPAPAREARLQREGGGNQLAWDAVPQAVAYRVYRLRPGEPPVWLNSPYSTTTEHGILALQWRDPNGKPEDRYRIHAVDAAGRESGW